MIALFLLTLSNVCTNTCFNPPVSRWETPSFNNEVLFDVHTTFKNVMNLPVRITQNSANHSTLLPHRTLKVFGRVNDVFEVRVYLIGHPQHNQLMLRHVMSAVTVQNNCEDTEFISCKRTLFNPLMRWTPPDSLVFNNIQEYPVYIYYYDGECEEFVDTIHQNEFKHIQSTLGHTFRIRNNKTYTQFLEYTIREVLIMDFEDKEEYKLSIREDTKTSVFTNIKNILFTIELCRLVQMLIAYASNKFSLKMSNKFEV